VNHDRHCRDPELLSFLVTDKVSLVFLFLCISSAGSPAGKWVQNMTLTCTSYSIHACMQPADQKRL
jgi:hypothetical protein